MKLSVENLTVTLQEQFLLNEINLTIESGDILAVIGPNGAGKSTLLKCLSQDIIPNEGVIRIDNICLKAWQGEKLAKSLAVLPQNSSLNFAFTVREVISLGRIPHNTGSQADNEIIDHIIHCLDLSLLANRPYPLLSGGEKQRTQIARVLAQIWPSNDNELRLLILDEPMNAIDIAHQLAIVKLLKELAKSGCTIVIVMHDFAFATQHANKTLILNRGSVKAFGDTSDALKPEVLEAVFSVKFQIAPHPISQTPFIFIDA